VHRSSIQS
jgi:ribonuclease HI